ncbi:efflux RND transporter periplasmic adaptor subunit [Pseudodesulfovibrio sp.]|nr:efflux RND transporter periplasmic adaptor subunit [Pseudodesulfovibrio sp.]
MTDTNRDGLSPEVKKTVEKLEHSRQTLAQTVGKMKAMQKGALVVVGLVLLWTGYHLWSTGWVEQEFHSAPKADGALHTMTIQPQPISQELSLSGKLEPLKTVNIPAPFDGPIAEIFFTYGEEVKRDQKLLRLDDTDIMIKKRNAESDYIKAKQDFDNIKDWKGTSDARSAQRDLVHNQDDVKSKKRKLTEAKELYKKGIISRNDLEQAEEDLSSAKDSLASAIDKFNAEKKTGDDENLRMGQIKLENSKATLDEYEAMVAKKIVTAPVRGVAVKPETTGSGKAVTLSVGSSIAKSDTLLAIADLESMTIQADADEVDVVRLSVGQKVHVTGEAFPGVTLQGKIQSISSQATTSSNDSRPTYGVGVTVDAIPPKVARTVRIGMTAELQVVVYENPKGLLVPIAAVDADAKTVQVIEPSTKKPKTVQVTTGITTMQDVEILSGLKAGDVVVTP